MKVFRSGDGGCGGGLNSFRTFRVLRPLRSLNALPGMRMLVNTVLLSLPKLGNVAGMALFLLTTFGILGLNFWGGVMHNRCRITPEPFHFVQPGKATKELPCKGWCVDPNGE